MEIGLNDLTADIADAILKIDASKIAFRTFQAGVGPYGEPQLVKLISERLNELDKYAGAARTKRTPDLLIPGAWALEFKITRPFGDNAREAENWSVNLLHPYPGSVSVIGDCLKLRNWPGPEQKAVIVIGYEHFPPKLPLDPLIDSFELIAKDVARIRLSERIQERRGPLVHPVHQALRVFAWKLLE